MSYLHWCGYKVLNCATWISRNVTNVFHFKFKNSDYNVNNVAATMHLCTNYAWKLYRSVMCEHKFKVAIHKPILITVTVKKFL